MQGLHLTADLYGCRGPRALLVDPLALRALCAQVIDAAGLSRVDEKFHVFPGIGGSPGGITGAVLLAQSHLAIHTWPEHNNVTLDVYVCNLPGDATDDNSAKAAAVMTTLLAAFDPVSHQSHRLLRGAR